MPKPAAEAAEPAADGTEQGKEYIAEMLAELKILSDRQGLAFLSYLIGMAQIEADLRKRGSGYPNDIVLH